MKRIGKYLFAALVAIAVLLQTNSVSAATNTQSQQQALLAQQIVNQQVALFQAAGVALTPEQLLLVQQNANITAAQQLAALEAQQSQLMALQAQLSQTKQSISNAIPVSNASAGNASYVLNKNSKKFHHPTCSSVGDMSPKNKIFSTSSRDEIIAQGYVPCKRCYP